jgi:hypothetical protein
MAKISQHTSNLIRKAYTELAALKHSNGVPVLRIYSDASTNFGDPRQQGSALAFNIQKSDTTMIPWSKVERRANQHSIYVRAGGLCNPGGIATYLKWSASDMHRAHAFGHTCSHPIPILWGKATGVVRVSMGAMSNEHDIDRLVDFIRETYTDDAPEAIDSLPEQESRPLTPFNGCSSSLDITSPPSRPPPSLPPKQADPMRQTNPVPSETNRWVADTLVDQSFSSQTYRNYASQPRHSIQQQEEPQHPGGISQTGIDGEVQEASTKSYLLRRKRRNVLELLLHKSPKAAVFL